MIQKFSHSEWLLYINISMFQSERVKIILLEEFAKSQAKNPHFSMRAYAKKLGVSQAAVSQIIAGKRPLTLKTAERILESLNRSPSEIAEILSRPEAEVSQAYHSLDLDSFHLISDWHHYAILSLVRTEGFKSSPRWIANRLGITEIKAKQAIDLLLRLDMLARDEKTKQLVPTGEQYAAISSIANPALRKANRQNLELATQALDEVDISERDYSAITLCFDPDRMEEAREIIKKFRRSFDQKMESGFKKEVYKLTIQLFPLSRREKK